jgi:hypothetical protein
MGASSDFCRYFTSDPPPVLAARAALIVIAISRLFVIRSDDVLTDDSVIMSIVLHLSCGVPRLASVARGNERGAGPII